MLHELKEIKSGKKQLREFGLLIGGVLIVLGGIALYRGKPSGPYLLVPGLIFFILGAFASQVLAPFQKAWMALGLIIGFFMSRVVLAVLFYLVITPMGILTRILGKDILDQKIEKNKSSYWKDMCKAEKPKESYENQY